MGTLNPNPPFLERELAKNDLTIYCRAWTGGRGKGTKNSGALSSGAGIVWGEGWEKGRRQLTLS